VGSELRSSHRVGNELEEKGPLKSLTPHGPVGSFSASVIRLARLLDVLPLIGWSTWYASAPAFPSQRLRSI